MCEKALYNEEIKELSEEDIEELDLNQYELPTGVGQQLEDFGLFRTQRHWLGRRINFELELSGDLGTPNEHRARARLITMISLHLLVTAAGKRGDVYANSLPSPAEPPSGTGGVADDTLENILNP